MGLLLLFIVASYAWTVRPSGKAAYSRGALKRLAPLAVLLIPAGFLLGFALILYPVAPPKTLVLRSQALLFEEDRVAAEAACLARVVAAAASSPAAEPPDCFEVSRPGQFAPAELYAEISKTIADNLSQDAAELIRPDDWKTRWNQEIANQVGSPSVSDPEVRVEDGLSTRGRWSRLAQARATWWHLVTRTDLYDVQPVVKDALDRIVAMRSGVDLDDAETVARISSLAISEALARTRPAKLASKETLGFPPPRRDLPLELIEAVEIAVLRLLVAEGNVVAVLAERHRRTDRSAESNPWRTLQEDLIDTSNTAHGRPVGLSVFEGSVGSASSLVAINGNPWKQRDATDVTRIYANLRFGAEPGEWRVFIEDLEGNRLSFSCDFVAGAPIVENMKLRDCLPAITLGKGDGLMLALKLEGPLADEANLRVRFEFPMETTVAPLVALVEDIAPVNVNLTAEASPAALENTMACLLLTGSPVSSTASIRAFRAALDERSEISYSLGSAEPNVALRLFEDQPNTFGFWVYPTSITWDRVVSEISIDRKQDTDLDAELAVGGKYHGLPLFPIAFTNEEQLAGIRPISALPLVPRRSAPLTTSSEINTGLELPQSAILAHPGARPVGFSALPDQHKENNYGVRPRGIAPLIWKISLGPDLDGRGEILVWFFDLDPFLQGLFLDTSCRPDWKDELQLSGDPVLTELYEPTWDETRFFPLWIAMMRAAGVSAQAAEAELNTSRRSDNAIPSLVTPDMLMQARIASSSFAMLLLSVLLVAYAVYVIVVRTRSPRG
ncbi:hypothetical protein [uncultured Roseibium sp.]|uniref:hypothetical protein n=1 Tax=uncultured Roseibium sp. TaxID=1936171 RepID=UPI002633A4D9|nr:hypothetical protein [uncultured Roseibium sp.]